MSLNGFNGQRNRPVGASTGRPIAGQTLGTTPQHLPQSPPQHAPQPSGQQPQSYEAQHWPQQGYPSAHQGYGGAGHGHQTAPYGGAGGLQGGYATDPYAPNFQPYNPASAAPEAQADPVTGGRGAFPGGSGGGLRGGIYGDPAPQAAQSGYQTGYLEQENYPSQDYRSFGNGQWPAPQAGPQTASHGANERGFAAGAAPLQGAHQEPTFGDWQSEYAPSPQQGYGYGESAAPEFGQRDRGSQVGLNTGMTPGGDPYGQGHPAQGYGAQDYGAQDYAGHDMRGYATPEHGRDPFGDVGYGQVQGGFAQAQGGELEQAYADENEEDYEDYEEEAPSRLGRPLMIALALAGAIFVGGGMAYGYKAFFGGARQGDPPVVKSASLPTRTKPADAGGMKFEHVDSKIMGRLGDGSGSPSSSNDLDESSSRKVATLVVGRDGSIQAPPSSPAASDSNTAVSVPGLMVVDALGPQGGNPEPAAQKPVAVIPPVAPVKPVAVAKTQVLNGAKSNQTGSIDDPPAQPAVKRVAAAALPSAAVSRPAPVTSGNGYVAVLASVPKSSSSRMDALKRFADLQQQFSSVLAGKTPDVAEAQVGAKGAYHRLVVGPPGSRQQASSICSGLKAQGYKDCWVTAY